MAFPDRDTCQGHRLDMMLAAYLDRYSSLERMMQVYAATNAASGPGTKTPRRRAAASRGGELLLLTESARSLGGAPSLFEALSQGEREVVLRHGRRKVFYRGQTLFNQGTKHDGIYLI